MPTLSVEYRIKLRKVALIVAAWLIVALLMTGYERSAALSTFMQKGAGSFDFAGTLGVNLAAALLGGLMGGTFLVFYVNERFRARPYGWTVLAVALSFVVIVSLITLALAAGIAWRSGHPLSHPAARAAFMDFATDSMHLKNIIFWAPVVMLTQFTLQIGDKFGPRVLWHFLWGRYNVPREEERIFMFVDLKSSTTIAERLGNERYHRFLRDYFADLTDPTQYSHGEIYQYVGDEVVVSWTMQNGLVDSQCLRCFFAMQRAIAKRADTYRARYGTVPAFKAGLHFGQVIAGEIGIIKRDITYSGDVLNTTARIQGSCNALGVELLCSEELLARLPADQVFERTSLGKIELKGKCEKVDLATVRLR